MVTGLGRNITDDFLRNGHFKIMKGKTLQATDKLVHDNFPPETEIVDESTVFDILQERTGLNPQHIAEALERLLQKSKLIVAKDSKQNRYFCKNPYR